MEEVEARMEAIGIKTIIDVEKSEARVRATRITTEDTKKTESAGVKMIIDPGRAKSTFYTAMELAGIQAAKRYGGLISWQ